MRGRPFANSCRSFRGRRDRRILDELKNSNAALWYSSADKSPEEAVRETFSTLWSRMTLPDFAPLGRRRRVVSGPAIGVASGGKATDVSHSARPLSRTGSAGLLSSRRAA